MGMSCGLNGTSEDDTGCTSIVLVDLKEVCFVGRENR